MIFSVRHETEKFIPIATTFRYWGLQWTKWIQPAPFYVTSIKCLFNIIPLLTPNFHVVSCLDFLGRYCCSKVSPLMRATCPSHHMRFNFITQIIFQDKGKPRQLCLIQLPSSIKKNERKILPQTVPEDVSRRFHVYKTSQRVRLTPSQTLVFRN
jgi:hypothetical protein